MKRLLTIGHSYVVAGNRRLAHEMALAGAGEWEVMAAAPQWLAGDLRTIALEASGDEACEVRAISVRLASVAHLRYYGRELREVLSQRWDVVHVWEEPYVAAGHQIARLAGASACVVPATFQNISKRYPPPFAQFERAVMRRADGWIAFGTTVREAMHGRRSFEEKPARVIPPGVDLSAFRPDPEARARVRRELGWDERAYVVGFVGRFVPEKGLDVLMRALEQATVPWHALFVGAGPLAARVRDFAARHAPRVRVCHGVPHDAVPAYMNAMDVLCVPSQTTAGWREQFGRVLIEAMAVGTPVLASRSGEIPHVVGACATLVDERDAAAWTLAIQQHAQGHGGVATGRASALVRERYAWPVVARAHLDFFDDLLSRRCAA
jgi:glycosyltransferase involved in cell wall biosynthesis